MSRLFRISLCLLMSSVPFVGLQAQPWRCDDGIRTESRCRSESGSRGGDSCCCPEPSGCSCQAPAGPAAPSAAHPAVPTPSHALDEAFVVVQLAPAPTPSASLSTASADSHPIQVHPEKLLARLRVLQI